MPQKSLYLALATALALGTACTDEQVRPSVAEEIVGEYYLSERSGGIAGTVETYDRDDAPVTIAFGDDGLYRYVTTQRASGTPAADTVRGQWFMTEVARLGADTFDFRFTNQLPGSLSGARARLVAGQRLSFCDEGISDGFCSVFSKEK